MRERDKSDSQQSLPTRAHEPPSFPIQQNGSLHDGSVRFEHGAEVVGGQGPGEVSDVFAIERAKRIERRANKRESGIKSIAKMD